MLRLSECKRQFGRPPQVMAMTSIVKKTMARWENCTVILFPWFNSLTRHCSMGYDFNDTHIQLVRGISMENGIFPDIQYSHINHVQIDASDIIKIWITNECQQKNTKFTIRLSLKRNYNFRCHQRYALCIDKMLIFVSILTMILSFRPQLKCYFIIICAIIVVIITPFVFVRESSIWSKMPAEQWPPNPHRQFCE